MLIEVTWLMLPVTILRVIEEVQSGERRTQCDTAQSSAMCLETVKSTLLIAGVANVLRLPVGRAPAPAVMYWALGLIRQIGHDEAGIVAALRQLVDIAARALDAVGIDNRPIGSTVTVQVGVRRRFAPCPIGPIPRCKSERSHSCP